MSNEKEKKVSSYIARNFITDFKKICFYYSQEIKKISELKNFKKGFFLYISFFLVLFVIMIFDIIQPFPKETKIIISASFILTGIALFLIKKTIKK